MSTNPTWSEVDVDGAFEEALERVTGQSRRDILRKAAFGSAAVLGGGSLLGAFAGTASAGRAAPTRGGASNAVPASDVAILNFALTLEYLEAAFYIEAVASGALTGPIARFARVVKAHEVAHVAALRGTLGRAAVKKPKFDFKGTTQNAGRFRKTAQLLEDTGVAAYLGQVGNIKARPVLLAAGSILPIEARHAGWIRGLNGVNGAPTAFEKGKSKGQILAAVKGTGFIRP